MNDNRLLRIISHQTNHELLFELIELEFAKAKGIKLRSRMIAARSCVRPNAEKKVHHASHA